jgi:hypothetical protein
LTIGSVGRYERRQGNDTCLDEEFGHLADTADVLFARLLRKTQVRAQSMANVITVKHECMTTPLMKRLLDRVRDCRFARA